MRPSHFTTDSALTRARSQQKAQRRSVISTKAWHCFMVSITGARSAHSKKRRGSIRNAPWHIGARPSLPVVELAWKEITLAKQNASSASEVERALIGALSKRYSYPQPEDRSPLDQAYAEAMREVWKRFPNDVDVGTLFAEAMMDLRPWNQWTPEGEPNPGTDEIIATLNAVLKLNPRHPFANHLYIHAVEASPHPERADAAADRLRKLQPGLAHNVHMPSHIDIRRGRWHEAIATNAKAVQADKHYRAATGNRPLGLFPMYAAHNQHMLAYAALMTGQSKLAMRYVREMIKDLPAEFVREN